MDEFNFLKILPQASVPEAPSDSVRAWGVGVRCEQIRQERCSKLEALQPLGRVSDLPRALLEACSTLKPAKPLGRASYLPRALLEAYFALKARQTIGSGLYLNGLTYQRIDQGYADSSWLLQGTFNIIL